MPFALNMPGVCESDQGFERKQMKKIQNVIARVLQDTALTMLQGCSLALSGFRILRKSLHLCQRRHLHPGLRLHGFSTWFIVIFLVFAYMVGDMVPSGHRRQVVDHRQVRDDHWCSKAKTRRKRFIYTKSWR